MAEEKREFQAEVAKLLDIVVHSLYSNKEIFLRELVSNASDACDKLRYESQTQTHLAEGGGEFCIRIQIDKDAGTLTIADNGIGMNHDDLISNLGTIAKSGTAEFMSRLSGDAKKDTSLIGQFGVGFYSAFMVADTVTVFTRKAGETQGWRWESDGKGSFTIAEDDSAERGARMVLNLRDDAKEFLEAHRLRAIIKRYSDHIAIPVMLAEKDKDEETVNSASALWTRSKADITAEQYTEFYHHVAHAFDEPWLTVHYKAEGAIEYTGLLYVPGSKPFDLFQPERKNHLKLYVKRIFITDEAADLLPPYLRFLRGVVDSQDLPLNVSREMLQHNPVLAKIKTGLVKRVLSELKKKAEADAEAYAAFWENFGAVLKEGIYEDFERKTDIVALSRFQTTQAEGWTSLDEVVARMKDGQEAIYYATGDSVANLKKSPQLEGFIAKGVEVLLLTDPIDEFWVPSLGEWNGKKLISVTDGSADLSAVKADEQTEAAKPEAADNASLDTLIAALKLNLGDKVRDVRASDRLTNSAVCLVTDAGQMSLHLEKLLKAHKQVDQDTPRILEINPRHGLIKTMAERVKAGGREAVEDASWLLLDQARIVEGEMPADPVDFARRLASIMEKGIG
ncbi:molecular chaperone HSP90 family(High temperature protein G) [Magnetospirillum gryphiswaldense MSR-1 v2]|uniref:Chaperone protein HtpG n=1 Tax=Magnetospirillum gryphiswaldense (strain DSM 6361 / JCM 21280 / NBRC 15271 / MSR-1) TaxID=431944 RepID=V6F7R4_MAGGM|nr:molecular chaperone HtpG [Magnetospirillum gryphiswaldense]CDL00336.1 molecular chaperone HSP90 family(High temperature protein G) [Magnetospirillum gryphiswaldense MSR-1 v2]